MMYSIRALKTNIIWIYQKAMDCVIIDPGEAKPIVEFINNNQKLKPLAILITHHHYDHTAGAQQLRDHYKIPIFGPQHEDLQWIDHICRPNTTIELNSTFKFQVYHTPGHTLEHLIYADDTAVFTGDTLFSAGCGRLFEGTAIQMTESLEQIKALPDNLLMCCGHEYTVNNLRFALSIEPNNTDLMEHLIWSKKQIAKSRFTLPIPLQKEKKINPFLRLDEQNLIQCLQSRSEIKQNDPVSIFKYLRTEKDRFQDKT